MRSQRDGDLSAITKVKVLSPEIKKIALGQGFCFPEASIAACAIGKYASDVPGPESMAGKSTVHIGTWENHLVPKESFQQVEEARRKYGGMVVRLPHSRGVTGAMSGESRMDGALEGGSSRTQRDASVGAIH
jgi:hypothetical protein